MCCTASSRQSRQRIRLPSYQATRLLPCRSTRPVCRRHHLPYCPWLSCYSFSSIPIGSSLSSAEVSSVGTSSVGISPGDTSFPKRLCLFFSCFFCLVNSFFLFSLLNAPGLANVPPLGQRYFMLVCAASYILYFSLPCGLPLRYGISA